MTVVSRLQLTHPALSDAGGAGLHTAVEAIYRKIGDAIGSRFFTQVQSLDGSALLGGQDVDFTHNFKTVVGDLRWHVYTVDNVTLQLTRVTATSTPNLNDLTVAVGATPTTQINLSNNTGTDYNVALVVFHDALRLDTDVVGDVLIQSAARGHVLRYNSVAAKWVNEQSYKTIGGGVGDYTTMTAAMAAAVAGDYFEVIASTAETAALSVPAGVYIHQRPNTTVTITGALTNGVRFTGAKGRWTGMNVQVNPTGAMSKGVSVEAADCWATGWLELNTAQTLTDALNVGAGGVRAYVQLGVKRTAGTITNLETNSDGASKTDVWGG
jgi:hypothetical protein